MYLSIFNFHRCTFKLPSGSVLRAFRRLCSAVPEKKSDVKTESLIPNIYDEYPDAVECYRLPGIIYVNYLASLKLLSVPYVTSVVLGASILQGTGTISPEFAEVLAVTHFSFQVHNILISIPVINFIGFLYIDKNNSDIIVSYVNFWGNRMNEKFPAGDLYFQTHKWLKFRDKLYVFVVSRKTGRKFKINFKLATIGYEETIINAIGELPESAF